MTRSVGAGRSGGQLTPRLRFGLLRASHRPGLTKCCRHGLESQQEGIAAAILAGEADGSTPIQKGFQTLRKRRLRSGSVSGF